MCKTNIAQTIYISNRKVAVLRSGGALCDIRRHSNGFLYNPPRVAVANELLDRLDETAAIQFTNLDTGDVWMTSVRDFRRWAHPVQYPGYEPQSAVELARLSHVVEGVRAGRRRKRKNEPMHVEDAPLSKWEQSRLWG